jgi:DUF1680 family protein
VLERALYNGALGGMALSGEEFFYENHLNDDGGSRRQPWFDVACCPPNIARLVASLHNYIYLLGDAEIVVALYVESTADLSVNGRSVRLRQTTDYPGGGTVRIDVHADDPVEFVLRVRVPAWADVRSCEIQAGDARTGLTVDAAGFVSVSRVWAGDASVSLVLEMPPRLTYCHPGVTADAGRVSVERGPLVYCMEGIDVGADPRASAIVGVDGEQPVAILDGDNVPGVRLRVRVPEAGEADAIYSPNPPTTAVRTGVAVPFYARANRQPTPMAVWLVGGAGNVADPHRADVPSDQGGAVEAR